MHPIITAAVAQGRHDELVRNAESRRTQRAAKARSRRQARTLRRATTTWILGPSHYA